LALEFIKRSAIFEELLRVNLFDFISIAIAILIIFKHRYFNPMFENSKTKTERKVFYWRFCFSKWIKSSLNPRAVTFFILLARTAKASLVRFNLWLVADERCMFSSVFARHACG